MSAGENGLHNRTEGYLFLSVPDATIVTPHCESFANAFEKARKKMNKSHPVDRHVGQRVRIARLARGMSQSALAEAVGLTFQQI